MNDALLLAARLVVAGSLAVAGAGKLVDRDGLSDAAEGLGVPARLAAVTRWVLPPVELVLAALLLIGATAFVASVGAVALLIAFTALLVSNLARGRRPACHCFGSNTAPITWWSVARNAVLLAATGAVIGGGPSGAGPGLFAYPGDRLDGRGAAAAIAALVVVVVAQAFALFRMFERIRRVEAGANALPATLLADAIRLPAPSFSLPALDGSEQSLSGFLALGRRVLLLFTSPTCRPCRALMPEVADWQERYVDSLTIVVLSSGAVAENRAKADELGLQNVLVQDHDEVGRAFGYDGTPGAVLVDVDGRIASEVIAGAPAIRQLLATAVAGEERVHARAVIRELAIGDDAPDIVVPTLTGDRVGMYQYLGRMTIVLFWSPTCGFCEDMLPAWHEWEESAKTAEGVPALVITRGDAAANAGQEFQSEVGLDRDGITQRAFGADATPMSVIVDAEGRIASSLAVGAPDVLAMAERVSSLGRVAARLAPPVKPLIPVRAD